MKRVLGVLCIILFMSFSSYKCQEVSVEQLVDYYSNHFISIKAEGSSYWVEEQLLSKDNPFEDADKRNRFLVEKVGSNEFKLISQQNGKYCGQRIHTSSGYNKLFYCYYHGTDQKDLTFMLEYDKTIQRFYLLAYLDFDPSTILVAHRSSNGFYVKDNYSTADLSHLDYQVDIIISGCKNGLWLESQECLSECSEGYYGVSDEFNICVSCSEGCTQCTDKNTCTTCGGDYVLANNDCTISCQSNQFVEDLLCQNCPTGCSQCSDSETCNQCESQYFLEGDSCVQSCSVQATFANSQTNTCDSCSSNCRDCTDQSTCTTCENNYHLLNGACVADCGNSYFSSNNVCQNCAYNCSVCSDSSSCQVCSDGFQLDSNNVNCVQCSSGCLECASNNVCLTCNSSYLLEDEVCVQQCKDGNYPTNRDCLQCKSPCITCSSQNSCDSCQTTHFLQVDQCVEQCSTGYYQDQGNCLQCPQGCSACSDVNTCTECSGNYLFVDGVCTDTGLVGDNVNVNLKSSQNQLYCASNNQTNIFCNSSTVGVNESYELSSNGGILVIKSSGTGLNCRKTNGQVKCDKNHFCYNCQWQLKSNGNGNGYLVQNIKNQFVFEVNPNNILTIRSETGNIEQQFEISLQL